jgi:hypothetical protein
LLHVFAGSSNSVQLIALGCKADMLDGSALCEGDAGVARQAQANDASLDTGYTPHATRRTSHVTRHTSHVTRHTSHVTRHTSHVTRHTSHVTRLQHLFTNSIHQSSPVYPPAATAVTRAPHSALYAPNPSLFFFFVTFTHPSLTLFL